jgi:hypothetical protein
MRRRISAKTSAARFNRIFREPTALDRLYSKQQAKKTIPAWVLNIPHRIYTGWHKATGIETVAQFLDRFYKPDRYTGRGAEYASTLLASHELDFITTGYDLISHFDSVTGEQVVLIYGSPA